MVDEIINRVSNSPLITIDLTDYAPKVSVKELDIKDFLFEGIILKEKEFRNTLKEFNFSVFSDKVASVYCSSDAVVPMWAFMLITSYLNNIASEIHFGTKEGVFQKKFSDKIESIDASEFEGKKVIVKGCGEVPLTEDLYIAISKKLLPIVNSLMFGEACSAVPVFKKK